MSGVGKRNKTAGSNFERKVVKDLKNIGFPGVGTTRNNSRQRDAQKIDVMNCDEGKDGRLPYNIQCKNLAKLADYPTLLAELPSGKEINVIFHKKTKKSENGRFIKQGEYAILALDDMYDIMKRILELEDEVKSWKTIL